MLKRMERGRREEIKRMGSEGEKNITKIMKARERFPYVRSPLTLSYPSATILAEQVCYQTQCFHRPILTYRAISSLHVHPRKR